MRIITTDELFQNIREDYKSPAIMEALKYVEESEPTEYGRIMLLIASLISIIVAMEKVADDIRDIENNLSMN